MARNTRQASRAKKKQTGSRTQPVARRQRPAATVVPIQEKATPVAVAPAPPADAATGSVGRQRGASSRTARPYQHRRGRLVVATRSTASGAFMLPREQEYGFIRSDLRRLLITAAVLTAMMVALLVILEP